jgi:3-dehydroquinate dehydratase-2
LPNANPIDFSFNILYCKFEQMKIQIINGPNLNLLGVREKSIYGSSDFDSYLEGLRKRFEQVEIYFYQSNVEGEIINKLHEIGFSYDGVVLNAGAYTHTSVAIADAISAINTPVIEVHISNVYKREEFRHTSMLAASCKGVIAGFGLDSYRLAIENIINS